jgi:hypothetical protein
MTQHVRSLGAVFALLAVVLAACLSGSLSVDGYATDLENATDAYISESQSLSAAFQNTVEDEVATLAEAGEGDVLELATAVAVRETTRYLASLEDAMARYIETLREMSPPAVLVEPHDAYVEAFDTVRSSMPATRTRVSEAADLDGVQAAITGSGFSDGQLRLRSACSSLEAAVRAEGRGIDLGCTRPLQ